MKRSLQMKFVKEPRPVQTGTTTSHVEVTKDDIRDYVHMGAIMFAAMYGSKKLVDTACQLALTRLS